MGSNYIEIQANDGGQFNAYVANPTESNGAGILLLQEIFGVNRYIRGIADSYAEAGYTVVAPDLFWRMQSGVELGYSESDRSIAYDYYQRFDIESAVSDMASTVSAMREKTAITGSVGAMGFCLGGKLAYLAAAHVDINLAIGYYPVGIEEQIELADQISCPVTLHIAQEDHLCPPEAQQLIQTTFANRKDCDIYTYPNVGHAFGSPERDSYDADSTELARSRSLKKCAAVLLA